MTSQTFSLVSVPNNVTNDPQPDSNFVEVQKQVGGTCYANAAASAYLQTCARIYGCTPPSMAEAVHEATYSHYGGHMDAAVRRIEAKYHFGVRAEQRKTCSVLDLAQLSVIVSFALRSESEWQAFAQGEFLRPLENGNKAYGSYHACVVEAINYERSELGGRTCVVLKNSWGKYSGLCGQVVVDLAALVDVNFTIVYFTVSALPAHLVSNVAPGHVMPPFQLVHVPDFEDNFSHALVNRLRGMTAHYVDDTAAHYRAQFMCFRLRHPDYAEYPYLAVDYEEALNRLITRLYEVGLPGTNDAVNMTISAAAGGEILHGHGVGLKLHGGCTSRARMLGWRGSTMVYQTQLHNNVGFLAIKNAVSCPVSVLAGHEHVTQGVWEHDGQNWLSFTFKPDSNVHAFHIEVDCSDVSGAEIYARAYDGGAGCRITHFGIESAANSGGGKVVLKTRIHNFVEWLQVWARGAPPVLRSEWERPVVPLRPLASSKTEIRL